MPAAGAGLLVITLAGYLLRQLVADRAEYRQAIADERERTRAAESRATTERNRADRAQALVDTEREKRRVAEGAQAAAAGQLAAAQQMVRWYSDERTRLERYLPHPVGGLLPDPPEIEP